MEKLIRIGLDTSKSVFQLHGVDANERCALRKKLRRHQVLGILAQLEPTTIGLEACGGSHHWAREIEGLGHKAVLLPPQYVKPYVKRGKNDAIDSEAICEAMSRPSMRFVAVKSAEQQAAQMLITTRENLIRRRTQLSNAIRGNASEFGVVAAKGLSKLKPLLERLKEDARLPALAKEMFALLGGEYAHVQLRLEQVEKRLMAFHRKNEMSRRVAEVAGIGPITATALTIKVSDPKAYRSGRDLAAWIGLTPKDHSTAGKTRLGVITRAGDEMLRSVLIVGAMAHIQQVKRGRGHPSPWLVELLKRKTLKHAAVALANKNARIAWKLMVSGERYRAMHRLPATQIASA
jgi:transposase